MTDHSKTLEVMARAAKAVLGEMLGAKPLPPPVNNADDWAATSSGQSIDLVEAADRFLTALQAEGMAVVPVETIETLEDHIGALLRILEDAPYSGKADEERVLQIARAFGERCLAAASPYGGKR